MYYPLDRNLTSVKLTKIRGGRGSLYLVVSGKKQHLFVCVSCDILRNQPISSYVCVCVCTQLFFFI
jgi:hypothetical protein